MSSNLHFTIEERIVIKDDQPPVSTFVSMEVKPNLRVDESGENVTISGSLSVYGTYRSEEEQDAEELSPLITDEEELTNSQLQQINREFPVSITIPSYRIKSLSEISADIDSFDYQLHSSSDVSVNVTLAVTGINEEEAKAPKEEEEEIVVVHRASHWNFAREEHQENDERTYELVDESVNEDDNESVEDEQEAHPLAAVEEEQRPEELNPPNEVLVEASANDDHSEKVDAPLTGELSAPVTTSVEIVETEEREPEPAPIQESLLQEEVKVAITSKKAKQEATLEKPLSSFFSQSSKQSDTLAPVEENSAIEDGYRNDESDKEATPNTLDWKRMLIRDEKEQSFRSLKMVIVNGNRTLEEIAQKYKVTTSKLLQMNNLESAELEEGQILYVPQS